MPLAAGTQIAVLGAAASMDIEALFPDVLVRTRPGPFAPLAGCQLLPPPLAVRILAGALGRNLPARDLVLGVETLICFTGIPNTQPVTTPAAALLNGRSIVREPARPGAWYALLFAEPRIVLAENLPIALGALAPLLPPGPTLGDLRSLAALNALIGLPPPDPAPGGPLYLVADGHILPPEPDGAGDRFRFILPAYSGPVRLISPAGHSNVTGDDRPLGVCVAALALDDVNIPLDTPDIGLGWHPFERDDAAHWRWTTGNAWLLLPDSAMARTLTVVITDWHTELRR